MLIDMRICAYISHPKQRLKFRFSATFVSGNVSQRDWHVLHKLLDYTRYSLLLLPQHNHKSIDNRARHNPNLEVLMGATQIFLLKKTTPKHWTALEKNT